MEKVVMAEEHSGDSEVSGFLRNLSTMAASKMSDLPQEVMIMIFENLDSFSLKKIERVCKGWMEIIRGTRKFRTHLQLDFPPYRNMRWVDYVEEPFMDWALKFYHLMKPDLKVVHLKPHRPGLRSRKYQRSRVNRPMQRWVPLYGVNLFRQILGGMGGGDWSNVEIVISGCTVICEDLVGFEIMRHTNKIRMIRSDIKMTCYPRIFNRSTLYVEELVLDKWDKVAEQIANLLFAENGPLTRSEADTLRVFERCLTIDGTPNVERVHRLADRISRLKRHCCVSGFDWIAALTTIATGGHVSKYTTFVLRGSMHFVKRW